MSPTFEARELWEGHALDPWAQREQEAECTTGGLTPPLLVWVGAGL